MRRGRDRCPTMSAMTVGIIERAVTAWETHLRALGRSDKTVDARTYWAARMLTDLGASPWEVSAADIESWLGRPHPWQAATRHIVILSLRQFFAWAQTTGHRDDDPTAGLVLPRRPRVQLQPVAREVLADAMSRATGDTWWMLRIACTTGLRRGEIARMHSSDVSDGWLIVYGKGGRVRRVPVPPDVAAWVAGRDGWCFPAGDGHLRPASVSQRIVRATGVNPHAIRRRYATDVYRRTHDLRSVQVLLGHSSIATTELYVGSDDAVVEAAARTAWAA